MAGAYILGGRLTRTPGCYYRVDPDTGRQTSKLLRDTNEYIHSSARSRIELEGPGVEDEGVYDCQALDPYKLKHTTGSTTKRPSFLWVPRSRRKNSNLHELPESPLWEIGRCSAGTVTLNLMAGQRGSFYRRVPELNIMSSESQKPNHQIQSDP